MKTRLFFGVMCLALILAAPAAQATTLVYRNGLPDNTGGGAEMASYLEADHFTLGAAATVTNVRFWAFKGVGYGSPDPGGYNESIVWGIYQNSGSVPGTSVASGTANPSEVFRTTIIIDNVDYGDSYRYDFSIPSRSLGAGTYWLSLHNGPLDSIDVSNLYWETSDDVGNYAYKVPDFSGDWIPYGGSTYAFELYNGNPVPLPGAVWLLGSGLLGLIGLRKKLRS